MTKTKKNPLKDQRPWDELTSEKKSYLLRKQQDQEDKQNLRFPQYDVLELGFLLEKPDDPTDQV